MAAQDGTGNLERGLGDAVRIFCQHPGSELGDELLRAHLEGPEKEEELFRRGPGGHWEFAPFGRALAREWLARHGRRFACYKLDHKGKGKPHRGRRKGSDRAVQAGQWAATKALVAQAARGEGEETIFGDDRRTYAAPAGAPAPPELAGFAARTVLTRRRKRRAAAGEAAPKPVLRLGETKRGPAARRSRPLGQSLVAALRRAASSVYVAGPPLPAEQLGTRRLITSPALANTADLLIVPAVEDLDPVDLAQDPLLVWLGAVAAGGAVVARRDVAPDVSAQSPVCVRYQRGTQFAAKVRVSDAFARTQKGLALALSSYAAQPGSKWKVATGGGDPAAGEFHVASLRTFQDFLLGVRRLVPSRGALGTFRAAAVAGPAK